MPPQHHGNTETGEPLSKASECDLQVTHHLPTHLWLNHSVNSWLENLPVFRSLQDFEESGTEQKLEPRHLKMGTINIIMTYLQLSKKTYQTIP